MTVSLLRCAWTSSFAHYLNRTTATTSGDCTADWMINAEPETRGKGDNLRPRN